MERNALSRKCVLGCLLLILACCLCMAVPAMAKIGNRYVVVLDPGHGGYDSGALAENGGTSYTEAECNWWITYYTKQALEAQGNIDVYVTRSENECPEIAARVAFAAAHNADLLVSQHINSADGSTAKGCCVLISRGYYREYLSSLEKRFGLLVINELNKVGISTWGGADEGMLYRLSDEGNTYPNGKPRDYYGIVARSVEANLPGVIIEHAFINNPSEASAFLGSKAKLQRLGEADARAIIAYLKTEPEIIMETVEAPKNGFYEEDGYTCYYENGTLVKNTIVTVDGERYLLNSKGRVLRGLRTFQGYQYYFNSKGIMQHGWVKIKGEWYYFTSNAGIGLVDVAVISSTGNVYVFDQAGIRQHSGFVNVAGKTYYCGDNGKAAVGLKKINGKYYYFGKNGALYKNEHIYAEDGKQYYAKADGALYRSGFYTLPDGGKTYDFYFKANGEIATGWRKINEKWYFFNKKNGHMLKNTTKVSGGVTYHFGADGICTDRPV